MLLAADTAEHIANGKLLVSAIQLDPQTLRVCGFVCVYLGKLCY